ncbi:Transposase (plasmid) [Shigella dysenteriae 1617]|uniref:Transposase n=1 Tax=Shigella dysenteriae 1617 TaxID=754093 RepID=A0A0A7A486_SHIDY|nr:hypothetical protein [Shigella dysenteriae]AHA68975.1 Transposase [Shigella dysenteriae 1617]
MSIGGVYGHTTFKGLLERLGHIPPAEAEKAYYAAIGNDDLAT